MLPPAKYSIIYMRYFKKENLNYTGVKYAIVFKCAQTAIVCTDRPVHMLECGMQDPERSHGTEQEL